MIKTLRILIFILLSITQVFAQKELGEVTSLEEVKVTAQKREENAQAIPIGISVLSAEKVSNRQIWTIRELTAMVPNLYIANPGDYRNVVSLRGVATTSYDQGIATYVDGINQFSLDTYMAQLNDVERIEVLRGPQGTLYGRNAMGGVINVITKQPTNSVAGFASADFGGYGLQRYTLGFRAPVIRDKLFVGASGNFNRTNGFYDNEFNQSSFDRQHSVSGNYYIKYLATPNLSYTLNIKHNENRNDGAFPLAGNVQEAIENPYRINQDAETKLVDNIFNGSLSVNYTSRVFGFISQTAYQSNYRYYENPIDGDFSPIDGISIVNNYGKDWNNMKVLTQEFRFNSIPNSSAFSWTTGVYGFYQHSPVKQGIYFGDDADLVGSPYPNSTSLSVNKGNNAGVAVFGDLSYAFSDRLRAGAGLRYDYERKRLSVRGEFFMAEQSVMVSQSDTSALRNFSAFTPKLTLDYKLADKSLLYTIYSTGFRSGGQTQLASDPSQPPLFSYDPEYSHNFEIGAKNEFFDNKLRLNLALYYIRINGVQVPSLILPEAITVTRNAGELNSRGVEFELAALPLPSLELNYSFGYNRAVYDDLKLSLGNSEVQLNNARQIFTPDMTSMLALRYKYGLNDNLDLVAGGEWRYIGDQFFDLSNTINQNGYHLANFRLGLDLKRVECYLWGSNIGNTTYIDYAYDFGATHLGNPRVVGLSLATRF